MKIMLLPEHGTDATFKLSQTEFKGTFYNFENNSSREDARVLISEKDYQNLTHQNLKQTSTLFWINNSSNIETNLLFYKLDNSFFIEDEFDNKLYFIYFIDKTKKESSKSNLKWSYVFTLENNL